MITWFVGACVYGALTIFLLWFRHFLGYHDAEGNAVLFLVVFSLFFVGILCRSLLFADKIAGFILALSGLFGFSLKQLFSSLKGLGETLEIHVDTWFQVEVCLVLMVAVVGLCFYCGVNRS